MPWNLSNSTQYAAAVALVGDRDGRYVWLTVIKATFDIDAEGQAMPALEQLPVVYAPMFAGDPARSSLLADSDVDYAKPGVDLLVQGTVYPSHGRAVEQLVRIELASRCKTLRVHGPRVWRRSVSGVVPSSAAALVPLPLSYELAFGGFDPTDQSEHDERNPAGCGFARRRSDLVDMPAPQIEYADQPVSSGQAVPAGLGPIARHWMPRRRHAGTYDQAWLDQRQPLLPADFNDRFFSSAPEDQQFAEVPPQARVCVTGMRPDGEFEFRLPRLALGINVHSTRGREHRRARLRTVQVLPDSRKLVLVYADAIECTGWRFGIRDVEVIEKDFIQ